VVVQALAEERLVLLPSETSYVLLASALSTKAVHDLMNFPQRMAQRRPSLLLRSGAEAADYVPNLSRVGHRIACRGWPGPLAIEFPVHPTQSLCGRLPAAVQQHVLGANQLVTLQVPAHQAISDVLQLLPGPVVAVPLLNKNGAPIVEPELTPEQSAVERLAFAVDDGPTHFGGLATVLRVDGHTCQLTADGVLDQNVLIGLGQLVVLLVCTGNTCRSPMAETLLRHEMTQRFKDLFTPGQPPPVVAVSAGLSAYPGGAASPEAVNVMHARGLNLKDHQSRPLTQRLLKQADLVLTMTASHRQAILGRWPEASPKTFLLSKNGRDVADPYGGSVPIYAACADEIESFIKHWVQWIDESWLPRWHTGTPSA
jgi:protein-tyrosine phosphatase